MKNTIVLLKKNMWFLVSIISICAFCSFYIMERKADAGDPYYVMVNNINLTPQQYIGALNQKHDEGYVFDHNIVLMNEQLTEYHITVLRKK